MSTKIDLFGVKIDNLAMDEVLSKTSGFLRDNKQHYIVLPYSEFIVRVQKDEKFRKILNEADLCLCESRGLRLVAKFFGKEIKENIYGVELIRNLIFNFQFSIFKKFLLGGSEKVIENLKDNLGNKIMGAENGYQDLEKVIEKIDKVKPNILLVGLGSPKQEKWIYENLKKMPSVKLAIGVGGAFDFISGRVKRAPKFLQKIGLEWFWRLILQPRRIKRIYNGIIKLSWLVLKCKISNK